MMYMLISAVGLSFFTLFAKLGNTNIPFMVLTWLRFFVPLLLVLPFLFFSGSYKTVSLFHIPSNQILRSLCVCVAQYSIFYYLTKSSLLNATVLLNTGPLFIPILERIFYKHEIEKSTWVSLFLCLAGVIFILQPDRDILSVISLIGLIAGLGQAGSQVLYGKNAHKEKNDVNLFYLFFLAPFSACFLYYYGLFFPKQSLGIRFCRWDYIPVLWISLCWACPWLPLLIKYVEGWRIARASPLPWLRSSMLRC